MKNGLGVKEDTLPRQRCIGVVSASVVVVAERMKARVLSKKFEEGFVSENSWILNKTQN